MQTQLTPNTEIQIPRYLGLANIEKDQNSGMNKVTLGYSSKTKKELELDDKGYKALKAFLKPTTVQVVATLINETTENVMSFCKTLLDEDVLQFHKGSGDLARYDRHLLFYNLQGADGLEVQKKLRQKTVALVGMGGIGCWSSINMIGAGFKELRLIDFDTIELSNLTRQILFKEGDIGLLKGAVAQRELQERNNDTSVNFVELKVDGEEKLKQALEGVDFVVVSADTPVGIHNWVDHVCFDLKTPYINVGYRDGVGVVGPLTEHGKTSCYECYKTPGQDEPKEEDFYKFYNRYQAPSFGPLNAMASTIATMEVIKFLGGMGEVLSYDTEVNIDPMTMELTYKKYDRDSKCWQCGDQHAH